MECNLPFEGSNFDFFSALCDGHGVGIIFYASFINTCLKIQFLHYISYTLNFLYNAPCFIQKFVNHYTKVTPL